MAIKKISEFVAATPTSEDKLYSKHLGRVELLYSGLEDQRVTTNTLGA